MIDLGQQMARLAQDRGFEWRVPYEALRRGFGVKTTSTRFMVQRAPFVVDVYLDGSHERFRSHIAVYA